MSPALQRCIALCCSLGHAATAAAAELELRVRAPVRCELALHRAPAGLAFSAKLTDDRDRGVGEAAVTLRLTAIPAAAPPPAPGPLPEVVRGRTDKMGVLAGRVSWASATGRVAIAFDGDERRGGCRLQRDFDVRRVFPTLSLSGPAVVREGAAKGRGATFEAVTDSPGGKLLVRLWRADGWREVPASSPDPSGRLRFTLDGAHEDGLGPATVRVEVLADAERNGVSVDRPVSLLREVTLTLRGPPEVSLGAAVTLSGDARAKKGGLRGALVSLLRDGVPVATFVADARGHFEGELPSERLGEGKHVLQASFTPTIPGLEGAASEALRVVVLPRSAIRGLTAILGGVALLVTFFLALFLRRRPRKAPRTVLAPKVDAAGAPALPLAPLRRFLRRLTASRTVLGVVVDGSTSKPLGGARIAAGDLESRSDPMGRFRIGPLLGPRAELHASSEGYAPEVLEVALPVAEARLVVVWPWREKILRVFGEVAVRLVPGPPLGARTPTELRVAAAMSAGLEPRTRALLEQLTDEVEGACYGALGADLTTWQRIDPLVAALRAAAPSVER